MDQLRRDCLTIRRRLRELIPVFARSTHELMGRIGLELEGKPPTLEELTLCCVALVEELVGLLRRYPKTHRIVEFNGICAECYSTATELHVQFRYSPVQYRNEVRRAISQDDDGESQESQDGSEDESENELEDESQIESEESQGSEFQPPKREGSGEET